MTPTIPHQTNLLLNLKSGGATPTKWSLSRRVKEKKWFIVMFADHRRIPGDIDQFGPSLFLCLLQERLNSVGHGSGPSLTDPPIEDEFLFWTDSDRSPCCRFFWSSRPLCRVRHVWVDAGLAYLVMQLHTMERCSEISALMLLSTRLIGDAVETKTMQILNELHTVPLRMGAHNMGHLPMLCSTFTVMKT